MRKLVFGIAAALCSACTSAQPEAAARQVDEFRAAYNARDYARVEALFVDRIRGTPRAHALRSFITETRERLGEWREQRLMGVYATVSARRGPALELRYRSSFAGGERLERFLFEQGAGAPELRSYRIYRER